MAQKVKMLAVVKFRDQKELIEPEFILAYNSRGSQVMAGDVTASSWNWEAERGHLCCAPKAGRAEGGARL